MSARSRDERRKAVVVGFDLDDTLYPEFRYAESALRCAGAALERSTRVAGIASLATRLFREDPQSRNPLQGAMEQLRATCTPDELANAVALMQAHRPDIAVFDDVMAAIERLRPVATLAIITEGRPVTQHAKIDALGLRHLFDDIIVTGELAPPNAKSTGAPYRALRDRHPEAERFFMIGDNPVKDEIPARACGFEVYLVRRPGGRYVHPVSSDSASLPDLSAAILNVLAAVGCGQQR